MIFQGVFFLAFLVVSLITIRLWRLRVVHRLPGVGWWVLGCVGIGMASLLAGASPFIGRWAWSMGAHIFLIGGFCALWIGVRLFVGSSPSRFLVPLFAVFLLFLVLVFYWFWLVAPSYQMRLTLNCLFLILFSLSIAQVLFSISARSWVGTTAGVLYMVFALVNGFRTINVILFPVPGSFFLSNAASRSMMLVMVPVLLVALAALEYLIRDFVSQPSENNE